MAEEHRMSTRSRKVKPQAAQPVLARFHVSMPHPADHNIVVRMTIDHPGGEVTLAWPAWTPGSYKVRDFARNVSGLRADGPRGPLRVELLDKQRRRIEAPRGELTLIYSVYADELSVRTPHLDDTHGFFLGTNLFPYIEAEAGRPAPGAYRVAIEPFEGWQVSTGLARQGENEFVAPSYDVLGDSIFEVGTHEIHSFKVEGKRHDVAFYGWGNFDARKLVEDIKKIVATEARMFGGLPYDDYLFVLHMTPDSGGGLEHLNSCVCGISSFDFRDKDKYVNALRLIAHEFFHVWNVKRIRPRVLGPFDYSREQHTRALWVMEGLTDYYDDLWVVRAGLSTEDALLKTLGEQFDREDNRPGRKVMSLEESSWLAWTKLYQADENWVNSGVSYYSRGAQIGFLLDARIRKLTKGEKSLDDVMRLAFERFALPKPGFEEGGFEKLCEEVAGASLEAFWNDHVRGTREIDYTEALEVYGLEFKREDDKAEPWLGMTQDLRDGMLQVRSVEQGSPAWQAGLQVRDEILALNGFKVTAKDFKDRLKDLVPGKAAKIALFRRGRMVEAAITPGSRGPAPKLVRVKNPTSRQQANFASWLWQGQ